MQPLLVKDIRILLHGELICGSELWKVSNAIYYKRHEFNKKNTLLFVSKHEMIDWNEINQKGPSLVITDIPSSNLNKTLQNTTIIRVQSLVQAYWKFIEYYRNLFNIPVVTITGTCGKTTTKEMIKHMLTKQLNVHASESSKNEPRRSFPYLMGIDKNTDAAVFEHGLGNSGNIKHQCMIYQPTIGIITTIGVHHLDGCKNLNGYIKAKAEIVDGIKQGGTLILNADDKNTKKISLSSFKGKIIYFGLDNKADFRASDIMFVEKGMSFLLHVGNKKYNVFVPGYGEHQVFNALAALAAINEIGINIEKAISRLATFQNMTRHLEFTKGIKGSTLIDDTWTNNPTSVEAALKVLDSIGKGKKVILILGDIKRLGNFEKQYHREIGSFVAKRKIHTLITIGSKAEEIARQAIADGTKANVHSFKDVKGVHEILDPLLDNNTILLIKGPMSSRSMIDFANGLKVNK
ncbi:UDP-N-acetylmuramoyl-tripeptide--D-alanyl-D-alanine ligase [Bacillus sp. Bva_UNVM-123]|uniref:Mur ligase family protein n=1 Tax=Bacillus sp. Bva_UNVM-123 TaxID=2829798 RepID=UPI00391FA366